MKLLFFDLETTGRKILEKWRPPNKWGDRN